MLDEHDRHLVSSRESCTCRRSAEPGSCGDASVSVERAPGEAASTQGRQGAELDIATLYKAHQPLSIHPTARQNQEINVTLSTDPLACRNGPSAPTLPARNQRSERSRWPLLAFKSEILARLTSYLVTKPGIYSSPPVARSPRDNSLSASTSLTRARADCPLRKEQPVGVGVGSIHARKPTFAVRLAVEHLCQALHECEVFAKYHVKGRSFPRMPCSIARPEYSLL